MKKSSHLLLVTTVLAALVLGVWSGKVLRGKNDFKGGGPEPSNKTQFEQRISRTSSRDLPLVTEQRPEKNRDSSASQSQDGYFTLPSKEFDRIEVKLIEGLSLNKKECEAIGLNEIQIRKLSFMIDDVASRWQEREKSHMKVISSTDEETLVHIPVSDPELARQEILEAKQKIGEIGGPGLEPLLKCRLIRGNNLLMRSNADTGLLNILTAGFGSLERFVRIKKDNDGGATYEIMDLLPERLKDVQMDHDLFEKFYSSGTFDGRTVITSRHDQALVSHLPLPK
jgi:hypothetical protein